MMVQGISPFLIWAINVAYDRSLITGAFDHSDDKGFMDIKSTGNRKNSLSYMVHGCSPF